MDNTFAIVNLIVSSMIPVLVALNWKRFDSMSCLERLGHSVMAISCACIVMKAGWSLSLQEFRSDMFGIIFRIGYLMYFAGNTYRKLGTDTFNTFARKANPISKENVLC